VSDKDIYHEWESKHTSPKVTVQVPTARAIKSAKKMSEKVEDDFMSALLQAAGDTVTIKTMGVSFDQAQSVSLKIEDARAMAKWILENTE
jgi:hypothetical protein